MAKPETITSYQFGEDSLIRRIDVRRQDNGRAVAYLYANPDPAMQPQRLNIRAAIRLKGWGTLSDHRNDEFSLRVSGLRNGDELIAALRADGFISSVPQVATSTVKAEPAKSLWANIRANSLSYSGMIATIGNTLSALSGVHRGKVAGKTDWGQIGQGLAFGIADLPLAIAGKRDDSRQLSDLLRHLKMHYDKNGIEIPGTASIHVETSDRGKSFRELAGDYLHRYANQIKCSMEVVAAFFTVAAGKNQGSKMKEIAPFIWGPGFLASLLIPERKIDEERYAKAGTLGRAWMKIQSNPLSVGGLLGYSNTIATYGSAINERREFRAAGGKGTPLYRWDFTIPSVMIGANGLYAISKKTVGGDIKNDALIGDVYTIAAQIINKQPEELREKVIESTARFLGERPEISGTRSEIIARLQKEVSIQRQNPWFEPMGLPAYQPVPRKHGLRDGAATTPDAANDNPPLAANDDDKPRTTIAAAGVEHGQKLSAIGPANSRNSDHAI